MNWKIENETLWVEDSPVPLPAPPVKALEYKNVLIVVLCWWPPKNSAGDRNLVGVDSQGKVLWQIEEQPRTTQSNVVTSVFVEEGHLKVFLSEGVYGSLDVQNGFIDIPTGQRAW